MQKREEDWGGGGAGSRGWKKSGTKKQTGGGFNGGDELVRGRRATVKAKTTSKGRRKQKNIEGQKELRARNIETRKPEWTIPTHNPGRSPSSPNHTRPSHLTLLQPQLRLHMVEQFHQRPIPLFLSYLLQLPEDILL